METTDNPCAEIESRGLADGPGTARDLAPAASRWKPKGGECSEHGAYEVGPDCHKCVQEVLAWTS